MEHPWQYGHAKPPSEQVRQGRAYLLDVMQRGVPGYPTDDRHLQSQKFTGVVYQAIKPLMREVRKADVVAYRRTRKRRDKTTFGPNVVAKSLPAGYGKGQRDDYIPLDADHPVARLLARPQQKDGAESIGDILEYATMQGCLTGVSPFWCVPSKVYLDRGEWRPVQLYALPTALTVPQPQSRNPQYPDGLYRITPYYASPSGGAGWYQGLAAGVAGASLDGREVKRRLFKHPLYRWDGYSPLTACAFLLDIAEAVDQARWSSMNSQVNPDIVMKLIGADEGTVDAVYQKAKQKWGGSRKNREPLIYGVPIEGGGEIEFPNRSAKEMDFQNSWEQVTTAVLAVFGTPRELVYGGGDYANTYALEKFFHKNTVRPECDDLGECLTRAAAEPWAEEPGELCIEVEPQEPKNEEVSVIPAKDRVLLDLVLVNEARASQNLPPLPGGDVIPSVFKAKQGIAAGTAPDPTKPSPDAPPNKGKGPTAGAPPRPENPEGEGTRPPTGGQVNKAVDAMSTLDQSTGGALVPDATMRVRRRKRLRGAKAQAYADRIIEGL